MALFFLSKSYKYSNILRMEQEKIIVDSLGHSIEPNAKPYWLKRVLAGIIDTTILFFAVWGLYSLALITPVANNLNFYRDEMSYYQAVEMVNAGYAIEVVTTSDDTEHTVYYNEESNYYYYVSLVDFSDNSEKATAYNTYLSNLDNNDNYQEVKMRYHLHNYVITAILCGGIAETIFFFIIPLTNKYRATIGKLLCGTMLYSIRNQTRVEWYDLIKRFVFLLIIESWVFYFFMAQFTYIIVPIGMYIISLFSKQGRTLHDFVSGSMVIDSRSYSPIYDDELEEEKEEQQ